MKVTKKELPEKSEVELVIEVSNEELKPHLENAAKEMSNEVKVPGFRPGQAPYDVMKKHVPEAKIYEQAFYKVVNKTLVEAVKKENIDFIGQPKVDLEKVAPGNPMTYKATLALMPKVKLGDYTSFKAKKKEVKADQKKVDKTFQDLLEMRAKETLVKREAKKGDKTIIDFVVKQNKVAIEGGEAKDYNVIIGDNQFIPGFEDEVVGMKAGEEKTFQLTFPEDYHQKAMAGKKCDFEVKLKSVFERVLPELDDQLAQSFNFKTVAEFKKQIEDNISKELKQKEDQRLELALLEEVMERSEFDPLPGMLVDSEVHKMMHELEQQIGQSGAKLEDYLKSIKKTKEELEKEFKTQATKRIKTALITKEVSKAEKLEATDKEVEAELAKMKEAYKTMPEMAEQIKHPEYKGYLKNMMANRKVFEFLASKITE